MTRPTSCPSSSTGKKVTFLGGLSISCTAAVLASPSLRQWAQLRLLWAPAAACAEGTLYLKACNAGMHYSPGYFLTDHDAVPAIS